MDSVLLLPTITQNLSYTNLRAWRISLISVLYNSPSQFREHVPGIMYQSSTIISHKIFSSFLCAMFVHVLYVCSTHVCTCIVSVHGYVHIVFVGSCLATKVCRLWEGIGSS